MKELKTAVYIGRGASHSWIWLVDTLDRFGFRNIQFVTDISKVRADLLVISGGDPFALFSHIKEKGVSCMRRFIEEGGTYVGICAGSYFALKFHDNPYPWLNMVEGRISNFSVIPPPNLRMPHKYTGPYREGYVFHPVREEVILQYGNNILRTPLYGGPGMISADAQSRAVYKEFTEKTLFLCERKEAEKALLQKSALIHKKIGRGQLFLFGPHFEHPYFPEANRKLIDMLQEIKPNAYAFETVGILVSGAEKRQKTKELKRWVSNGRLAAFGLENYHWKIGEKIYDPERLAYFFETCFRLVKHLEKKERIYMLEGLSEKARELSRKVKRLGPDPVAAEVLLEDMKQFTGLLYSLYFSTVEKLP